MCSRVLGQILEETTKYTWENGVRGGNIEIIAKWIYKVSYFASQDHTAQPLTVTAGQALNEISVFIIISGGLENSHYVAVFPTNFLLRFNMPRM
jgi:hypothetical protein